MAQHGGKRDAQNTDNPSLFRGVLVGLFSAEEFGATPSIYRPRWPVLASCQ